MEQRQESTAEKLKQVLRNDILKKRNALSIEEQQYKSRRIMQRLFQWERYKKAENILCYVSWRSEVRTQELIGRALEEGRKVYCPRVCGQEQQGGMEKELENKMEKEKEKEMEFYRIMDMQELQPGFQGIPEPQKKADCLFSVEEDQENTLMILPGAVFDSGSFHRIGYGGGYYDRYLARCGSLIDAGRLYTAAAAYELQLTGNLPAEAHDVRVEAIITEKRTYYF